MSTAQYTVVARSYTIHDKPLENLPIRRLQKEGGEVLSINELLHIALGRIDGFDELLREYGAQFLTTLHTVADVTESLPLDHIQATRLLAILALGKRLYSQQPSSLIQIRSAEDVYDHCRPMANLPKEQLRMLLINSRYQLMHEEVLSMGGGDYLHITTKEVLQPAVERGAAAVVLVHNHPSGDETPSTADVEFTKRIAQASKLLDIDFLDHLIIGQNGWSSCLGEAEK